ncbi:DUF4785 domain-containing protein [Pseudoalteromonas denitrificans]|uniref:DUF4785 domain-containing protein n=1 Tax=Pseudoalteromonas denitrificans DSM 6059 TaxID=1123010 RepID=A0A1I1J8K3_9GAMM|nr:DUF4785 domain-containing protein [Pseudoalteromonas denitrificans]SFC42938.1 hypothetical protein SAMN02745724_01637 [Pseudoalteromonas denitrificans DSM 6059]
MKISNKNISIKLSKTFTLLTLAMAFTANAQNKTSEATFYQWPTTFNTDISVANQKTYISDEYWQEVTGAQLNAGIKVYLSDASTLVKLAPKAKFDEGQVFKPQELELNEIQLVNNQKSVKQKLVQLAAQKDMALAGFKDGSIALKVENASLASETILKYAQPLVADDKYIVHVKDKNSAFKLKVTSPLSIKKQLQPKLKLNAQLTNKQFSNKDVNAYLISPLGEKVALKYNQGNIVFSDELHQLGAVKGLYQVELNITTDHLANKIKRTIKVPFIQTAETAKVVTSDINIAAKNKTNVKVTVPLSIAQEGRFAVKATLQGFNLNNQKVDIATAEIAQYLYSDASLIMPFKVTGITKGPYSLSNIILTDQTRMIVLPQTNISQVGKDLDTAW